MNETSAFVGSTPWNGGFKVEDGFIPPAEFMKAAGLDWKVETENMWLADGTQVPKTKVTRRSSDGKILGVVGDRYHVLQNEDAFSWFAPFIDSRSASFETAGSLKEGKVIWVLANTNLEGEVVKGDAVKSYILLSHSHDGTLSIRSGFTPIRVVCQNTLAAALNSASSKLIRLKHTKSAILGLEKVREIMDIANNDFIATQEQYKFLASKNINKKDLEKYVSVIFQKEEDIEEGKELRASTIEKIEYLFENGKGHELGSGTVWNAYNAVTEYLTWEKGRTTDNRLHSLWFGADVNTNQKAFDAALQIANSI